MGKKLKIIDLCILPLFIALEIILTRFCSINTPIVRIGFGFLPVALVGILYGPVWAGVGYMIGDVLGYLMFPTGPYFPGFTLTALLTGLVYGYILYKKQITWKRTLFAAAIVCCVLNLCLDTLWLQILYGQGILVMLPGRLLKVVIMVPTQTFLIRFVWNRCEPIFNKALT